MPLRLPSALRGAATLHYDRGDMPGLRTPPASSAAGDALVAGAARLARLRREATPGATRPVRPDPWAAPGARRAVGLASALLLAVLGLPLAVSFAVAPEDVESGRVVLSPGCHFKAVFGRECPTCGMSRAFCALSHGRAGDARRYNRAAPALYALWWAAAAGALATLSRALFVRNENRKTPA